MADEVGVSLDVFGAPRRQLSARDLAESPAWGPNGERAWTDGLMALIVWLHSWRTVFYPLRWPSGFVLAGMGLLEERDAEIVHKHKVKFAMAGFWPFLPFFGWLIFGDNDVSRLLIFFVASAILASYFVGLHSVLALLPALVASVLTLVIVPVFLPVCVLADRCSKRRIPMFMARAQSKGFPHNTRKNREWLLIVLVLSIVFGFGALSASLDFGSSDTRLLVLSVLAFAYTFNTSLFMRGVAAARDTGRDSGRYDEMPGFSGLPLVFGICGDEDDGVGLSNLRIYTLLLPSFPASGLGALLALLGTKGGTVANVKPLTRAWLEVSLYATGGFINVTAAALVFSLEFGVLDDRLWIIFVSALALGWAGIWLYYFDSDEFVAEPEDDAAADVSSSRAEALTDAVADADAV